MAESETTQADAILRLFNALIGTWRTVGSHPMLPSAVRGRASFGWLEKDALLFMRTDFEQPGPPSGLAVIGYDSLPGTCCMLYYDERGVSRIYQMNADAGVWKMWRDQPGFRQRFTGTFSPDGNTITGLWELSKDNVNWERDLELVYTRK